MKLKCFVVAVCYSVCVMAGKYSREVNEQKPGRDGLTVEFRIGKLNQVWEKAKRVRIKPLYLDIYVCSYIHTNILTYPYSVGRPWLMSQYSTAFTTEFD